MSKFSLRCALLVLPFTLSLACAPPADESDEAASSQTETLEVRTQPSACAGNRCRVAKPTLEGSAVYLVKDAVKAIDAGDPDTARALLEGLLTASGHGE